MPLKLWEGHVTHHSDPRRKESGTRPPRACHIPPTGSCCRSRATEPSDPRPPRPARQSLKETLVDHFDIGVEACKAQRRPPNAGKPAPESTRPVPGPLSAHSYITSRPAPRRSKPYRTANRYSAPNARLGVGQARDAPVQGIEDHGYENGPWQRRRNDGPSPERWRRTPRSTRQS